MNMKCAILDCFNESYREIFNITKKSKIKYCKKYKLDFLTFNFDMKDRTQHWGRILGIKKYIEKYDYLIYLDTDSIILDFNFDIKNLITDHEIIIGPLPHEGHIGTNGIILKNTKWIKEFLNKWFNKNQFIDSCYCGFPSCGTHDNGGFKIPKEKWKFYEQSAFHFMYDTDEEVRNKTNLIPRRYFHSVPSTLNKNDFLIHVPGMSKSKKIKILKKYAHKIL